MKVNIISLKGFTPQQENTIKLAWGIMDTVLNHDFFRHRLLQEKMSETKGLTPQEVWETITGGDWNIHVVGYRPWHWWSKVVGYFSGGDKIFINTRKMGSPLSVASLLVHENSHRLGFHHRFHWYSSVPYTLNRVFEFTHMALLSEGERRR